MQTNQPNQALELSTIRNFLSLIGLLLGFVGMISIDTFYSRFGIQYSDLDLPFSHIMYRGFSIIMIYPYVLIPYFIASLWLSLLVSNDLPKYLHIIRPTYFLLIIIGFGLTISSYYLGEFAGNKAADIAMTEKSAYLPRIKKILFSDEELGKELNGLENMRLLAFSGNYLVLIGLVNDPRNEKPQTLHIQQNKVHAIKTY